MEYETVDITDERARELAQVLANERAMAILRLLRERELSISEVSRELNMPISTVSYHIEKLLRVGLVEVSGRKYGKRLQEVKLYRTSSRPILLLPRPAEQGKTPHLNRLRIVTLSLATGISALVYRLSREHHAGSSTQTETIRALSSETARMTGSSGDYTPVLLAVITFTVVVFIGWFLRKRF